MSASSNSVGRWAERRLRRATKVDVLALLAVTALAASTMVLGRRADESVEPRNAVKLGELLDELDMPLRLPNAPLVASDGHATRLLEQIHGRRAVVAFYASWCGPCQKELPQLSEKVSGQADLLVVVSPDEDVESTRRALANLDLAKLGFFVDSSGQLQKEGRVTALPTTFLLTKTGAVLQRTVGFSLMELFRLERRLKPDRGAPEEASELP